MLAREYQHAHFGRSGSVRRAPDSTLPTGGGVMPVRDRILIFDRDTVLFHHTLYCISRLDAVGVEIGETTTGRATPLLGQGEQEGRKPERHGCRAGRLRHGRLHKGTQAVYLHVLQLTSLYYAEMHGVYMHHIAALGSILYAMHLFEVPRTEVINVILLGEYADRSLRHPVDKPRPDPTREGAGDRTEERQVQVRTRPVSVCPEQFSGILQHSG